MRKLTKTAITVGAITAGVIGVHAPASARSYGDNVITLERVESGNGGGTEVKAEPEIKAEPEAEIAEEDASDSDDDGIVIEIHTSQALARVFQVIEQDSVLQKSPVRIGLAVKMPLSVNEQADITRALETKKLEMIYLHAGSTLATVTGGKVEVHGGKIHTVKGGEVTLGSGTVDEVTGGKVTVNGGTVTTASEGLVFVHGGEVHKVTGGIVTVFDGEVGTVTGGVVVVRGGQVAQIDNGTVGMFNGAITNVDGGEIMVHGGEVAHITRGKLRVTGGTVSDITGGEIEVDRPRKDSEETLALTLRHGVKFNLEDKRVYTAESFPGSAPLTVTNATGGEFELSSSPQGIQLQPQW